MQRFRIMDLYSAWVMLFVLAVIVAAALLRRPQSAAALARSDQPVASVEAPQAADQLTTSPTPAPQEGKVSIDNFSFKPRELTVPTGATVTWVNHDDVPHTATTAGEAPLFDSKALDTDDKYSFKFTKPGTYKYYCKIHPHMTGTVIVN